MKIEKINDNQIRCTLTKEDLLSREIKLSELAYGTEKAKSLFRDMMQQAAYEFGFEANDIPLMIEAIPLSSDSIILIITKVEDPEELDTRFAKFSPQQPGDTPFGSSWKAPMMCWVFSTRSAMPRKRQWSSTTLKIPPRKLRRRKRPKPLQPTPQPLI